VKVGENGRLVAEDEDTAARLGRSSGRTIRPAGYWRATASAASRTRSSRCRVTRVRGIEKDILLIRDDRPFEGGRFLCA